MSLNKKKLIRVCCGGSCLHDGARSVMSAIEKETGLQPGQENSDYDYDTRDCTGHCGLGPSVQVNEGFILETDRDTVMGKIDAGEITDDSLGSELDIDSLLAELD